MSAPRPALTAADHVRAAQDLLASADEWLDADLGWKRDLTSEERAAHRAADLAKAQTHATLALVAAITTTFAGIG